ncbi:unnamed protein product, partial [Cladocopium goreaui]
RATRSSNTKACIPAGKHLQAYAQQAEEMARALEVLQETSASTSAARAKHEGQKNRRTTRSSNTKACIPAGKHLQAYAQQAEEMARALEVLQETSASTSAARAKHEGQKNRQGWRAGFEFLRLRTTRSSNTKACIPAGKHLQAYAQQAEEMARALEVLQETSASTSAARAKHEGQKNRRTTRSSNTKACIPAGKHLQAYAQQAEEMARALEAARAKHEGQKNRRTTRSSNTKACIPAGKHLQAYAQQAEEMAARAKHEGQKNRRTTRSSNTKACIPAGKHLQAYAQQAEEMARALEVLQETSASTSAARAKHEGQKNRRATRSSNTKACIPAGKHLQAYAQQAEEMARALEVLQETSASTSAARAKHEGQKNRWFHCVVMKLCGSVLCVLLLAVVRAVVGAPTDYASVRAEVVKAYAQQAEEMARALEAARAKHEGQKNRRTTRSSNTKACIPAGKHLQVNSLCCHEAVWLCSLCVAACRCTRSRRATRSSNTKACIPAGKHLQAARAKHKGQKNRQGWPSGFEFLRLQPFLMLYVLRSQVSQG